MEWNVWRVLNNDTATISTLRCLKLYLERLGCNSLDQESVQMIAGSAFALVREMLSDMTFLNCRPSVIAAAIMYAERRNQGVIPFWPSMLAKLTGYQDMSTPELSVAIKSAQRLCSRLHGSSSTGASALGIARTSSGISHQSSGLRPSSSGLVKSPSSQSHAGSGLGHSVSGLSHAASLGHAASLSHAASLTSAMLGSGIARTSSGAVGSGIARTSSGVIGSGIARSSSGVVGGSGAVGCSGGLASPTSGTPRNSSTTFPVQHA